MTKLTLSQLESFLWGAADILRGKMDASEFKNYIFAIMFIKRISDSFDEESEKIIKNFISKGKSEEEAKKLSDDPIQYNSFFIPENSRWDFLKDIKHDVGAELNKATEALEELNTELEGVLNSIDFNDKEKLPDNILVDLISHFGKYRLRNIDFESPDLMGSAYEYLIKMFADSAGKKGGEFYTPSEVVNLIVRILKPSQGMRVYDPTCGSGGMLIQSRNYLIEKGEDPRNISLFGQEDNVGTWSICKLNMFLHSVFNADIRKGDTLNEPQHILDGNIMVFDRVIANPPFSLKKWGKKKADNDSFGRFKYGTPPKDYGELAFLQHMIVSLNNKGVLGVVMPHGVLFRGGSEKKIRQGLIEDDLIEAIIGLPSNLFYGTGIPACILIINKNKNKDRLKKIIFINSEFEYEERGNRNILSESNIIKILNLFENYNDLTIPKTTDKYGKNFSKIINHNKIIENDYNLNIKRYADASPPDEMFDTKGIFYGGIPSDEINDEYIKEILKGTDVSCVLDKKNNDYCIFKSEIKSKGQIRQFLKTDKKPVINQFERWWDKYHASLYEINAEVKQSEEEMLGYLKELGYE